MGSHVSALPANVNANNNNNVKLSRGGRRMDKLAEDMRRITSAASKLRLHKRKDKVVQTTVTEKPAKESFKESPPAAGGDKKKESERVIVVSQSQQQTQVKPKSQHPPLPALPDKASTVSSSSRGGLPHHVVAATRVQQPRKWTLTDLLQSLGSFVQQHCTHLHTVPSASEVAMWDR
jgi:hypothetical protein